MILTDKAKKEFIKWNYDNDFGYIDHEPTSLVVHFENLDENLRNTVIVDFFDSVGIYINVLLDETNSKKFKYLVTDINIRHLHCWTQGTKKESRQEATTEAIIKANEIYNNKC